MSMALIIAFAALALLTLLALLWSNWPGWMKLVLVAGVSMLYVVGHDAVHELWGIPSTDALPERFVMLAAVVDEPTSKTPGAIYLWVSAPREGGPALAPRAYRVAYAKTLHAQVEEGLKKGRDGVRQLGSAEARSGNSRSGGWLKPGSDEQEIKIRDLPQPQLPEK